MTTATTQTLALDLITIYNGAVGGSQRLPISGMPQYERQKGDQSGVQQPLFAKGGHMSGKFLSEKLAQSLRDGTVQLVRKDGKLKFEIRFDSSDRTPVLEEHQVYELLDSIRNQNFGVAEVYDSGGDANLVVTPLGNGRVGGKPKVRLITVGGRLGIEFPTSLVS